jgi:methionyl-tRNA formyltransferase
MPPILIGKDVRFVYFGTPEFATIVLDELKAAGYLPSLIVTAPDKPKGRKLVLTQSEVKVWGE